MNQGHDTTWRFEVTSHRADKVLLVKMFNHSDKSMIPMQRESDDTWTLSLRLPPGRYQFTYFTAEDGTFYNNGAYGLTVTPPATPDPRVVLEKMEEYATV